jgi:CheY-like chemotaxis protein
MEQQTPNHPLNVMIIDDDPISNFLSSMAIKKSMLDLPIMEFQEGETALDYLHDNSSQHAKIPSIILLDLNMPGMDGWQFLDSYQKLRTQFTHEPKLVILTTSEYVEDYEKSKRYGFVNYYLVKPITVDKMNTLYTQLNIGSTL